MKRSRMREEAFKLIYSLEIQKDKDVKDQLELYLENSQIEDENAIEYMNDVVLGIDKNKEKILETIKKHLKSDWKIERISKIDLCILKLAIYEIKYKDLPYKVAINEAVELAKKIWRRHIWQFHKRCTCKYYKRIEKVNNMSYRDMAVSVSDLNKYIKDTRSRVDENLSQILVKGEISNFKNHYTGHMYFTLKDENSLIKCVCFKTYADKLTFMPKDGMKVIVLGSVSVFERDGIYQIYVKMMEEDGQGDLYTKYKELKDKLEKEGLFSEEHKKKIPLMPKIIGVLTSQTGSVIRDIINVSTRGILMYI